MTLMKDFEGRIGQIHPISYRIIEVRATWSDIPPSNTTIQNLEGFSLSI